MFGWQELGESHRCWGCPWHRWACYLVYKRAHRMMYTLCDVCVVCVCGVCEHRIMLYVCGVCVLCARYVCDLCIHVLLLLDPWPEPCGVLEVHFSAEFFGSW